MNLELTEKQIQRVLKHLHDTDSELWKIIQSQYMRSMIKTSSF